MTTSFDPLERLRQRLAALPEPPMGRKLTVLRPLATAALRDTVTRDALRAALAGSVEAAGAFAAGLRPDWRVTVEETPGEDGAGPQVLVRLTEPTGDPPVTSTATRAIAFPAFTIVVATLQSFAPELGRPLPEPLGSRIWNGIQVVAGLALGLLILLSFAAATLLALWDLLFEGWG